MSANTQACMYIYIYIGNITHCSHALFCTPPRSYASFCPCTPIMHTHTQTHTFAHPDQHSSKTIQWISNAKHHEYLVFNFQKMLTSLPPITAIIILEFCSLKYSDISQLIVAGVSEEGCGCGQWWIPDWLAHAPGYSPFLSPINFRTALRSEKPLVPLAVASICDCVAIFLMSLAPAWVVAITSFGCDCMSLLRNHFQEEWGQCAMSWQSVELLTEDSFLLCQCGLWE